MLSLQTRCQVSIRPAKQRLQRCDDVAVTFAGDIRALRYNQRVNRQNLSVPLPSVFLSLSKVLNV
jgi:hypothetical protein